MMKIKYLSVFPAIIAVAIISAVSTHCVAQQNSSNQGAKSGDVTGLWLCTRISSDDGAQRKHYFTLEQKGTVVTGRVEYPWGDYIDLTDGQVNGNSIHFKIGDGSSAPVYSGSIAGDHMHLTFTRRGTTTPAEFVKLPAGTPMYPPAPAPPAIESSPSNNLAKTPPMGWNAWNHFGDFINDKMVREIVDAMVASGMRDAGYIYVNIDDEWAGDRNADGVMSPNRNFPDMKALADYVHSKGMKLGLYSGPGPETCVGHIGSLGHEEQDAQTYAKWGVDYLKYDWCSAAFVYTDADMHAVYQKMGAALQKTGRPIVYSICQYGKSGVQKWGAIAGGNLWRTTDDISDDWKSVLSIWNYQHGISEWNKPSGWNDPDMLEVGNGGMSDEEYRAHFSMWALLSAPLLAGNDPRSMSAATTAILTNKDVIAIDQDSLGAAPRRVSGAPEIETWIKPLANGDFALLILNPGDTSAKANLKWSDLALSGTPSARDLWEHRATGDANGYQSEIPAHSVRMLRLSGVTSN